MTRSAIELPTVGEVCAVPIQPQHPVTPLVAGCNVKGVLFGQEDKVAVHWLLRGSPAMGFVNKQEKHKNNKKLTIPTLSK